MTSPANGQNASVSLLSQLLELGESLHGSALSVFVENYPQDFWKEGLVPGNEIIAGIGHSHYTAVPGVRSLRQELAGRDAIRRSQFFLSASNVAVTQGATHALNAVLQAFAIPNADVLIPVPSYFGYRDICEVLRLSYRPYIVDDSGTWLTEELLESLGPCSVMIVNTPHNPSGEQINTDQLVRLVERARYSGAIIIFDCVYDELLYEGKPPAWNSVFKTEDDLSSCIWVNSFSKNFGLPGVRLGWITASEAVIRRVAPVLEASVLCLPDFIQHWAARAVGRMSGMLAHEMKARRDYLCAKLSGVAGLEFKPPAAGVTIMAKLRKGSAMDLVQRLLRSQAALFLPGEAYYGGDPKTIRLCFGYSRAAIDEYVSILASVLGHCLQVPSGAYAAAEPRRPFVSA